MYFHAMQEPHNVFYQEIRLELMFTYSVCRVGTINPMLENIGLLINTRKWFSLSFL